MSVPLPIPKGFLRLGSFPLDDTSVFQTYAELSAYASTDPTVYAGQIVGVAENSSAYLINSDKSLTLIGGSLLVSLSNDVNNIYTVLNTNSAYWDTTYQTVYSLSASWGGSVSGTGIDTGVRALTSNWQNTYSTVQGTSSRWENVYTTVRTSSGSWSGGTTGAYLPLSGGTLYGTLSTTSNIVGGPRSRADQTSLAFGCAVSAFGTGYNIALGSGTKAGFGCGGSGGIANYAEGYNTTASGYYSYGTHAEGYGTYACGDGAHAEGYNTVAAGRGAHAEGHTAKALADQAHAEGYNTCASGDTSHAEGVWTIASGYASHAQGWYSIASGYTSHAGGISSLASGRSSTALGQGTSATHDFSTVVGFNIKSTTACATHMNQAIIFGPLSAQNVVYARGGNSDLWNSAYTTVNTNSGSWGGGGTGSYLPLTGGTITGSLSVTGAINALSANITYIDIKQYELSGFNVTGDVAIQGNLSSQAIVYANGGNSTQWNNSYTTIQTTSSNWENTYNTVQSTSSNWDSAYSIIQGASGAWEDITLTTSVTSTVTAGAITPLQVVNEGMTFQQFVEMLLVKTYYPTFTIPTATLTSNLASNVEVGTTGITLTVNYNRGSINGALVGGIWQPSTFQDYRAGVATGYTISGATGVSNVSTFPAAVIGSGSNTFTASMSYGTGPQPYDSFNNPYNSPLAAGNIQNITLTVNGRRKAFYAGDFFSSAPTTSNEVRALTGLGYLNPANGTTFSINIPVNATRVVFAYPATLRDVTAVNYFEWGNGRVEDTFDLSVVSVSGLNGFTPVDYKVYTYIPDIPFTQAATYNVTI